MNKKPICIIGLVIGIVIGFGISQLLTPKYKGVEGKEVKVTDIEHLGTLTYSMPDSGYYHGDNDIGITPEKGSKERISAKGYNHYEDMSQITVWEEDSFSKKDIAEFKAEHKGDIIEYSGEHGELPPLVQNLIIATDAEGTDDDDEHSTGTYYTALFTVKGKSYRLDVENDDDCKGAGELVLTTIGYDKTLKDEYK